MLFWDCNFLIENVYRVSSAGTEPMAELRIDFFPPLQQSGKQPLSKVALIYTGSKGDPGST